MEVDPSSGDQEASQDVTVDLATPSLTPEQIQVPGHPGAGMLVALG